MLNMMMRIVEPSSRAGCSNPGAAEMRKTINGIPEGRTFNIPDLIWGRSKSMIGLVIQLTQTSEVEKIDPASARSAVQDKIWTAPPEAVAEKEGLCQNELTNDEDTKPVQDWLQEPIGGVVAATETHRPHWIAIHHHGCHRLGEHKLPVHEEVALRYDHIHFGCRECFSLDVERMSEGGGSSIKHGLSIVRPHVLYMWRTCLRLFEMRGGQDGKTPGFGLADIEGKDNDDNVSERDFCFQTNLF